MSKYSPYFLAHTLDVEDRFCRYYVQDARWCHRDILDVPHMRFFDEEEAAQWLDECIDFEPYDTVSALRCFLYDEDREGHLVHRMDTAAVVWAAARELTLHGLKVVIRPKYGVAVELPSGFAGHAYPFRLAPLPNIDTRLNTLQNNLDALLLDQRRRPATLQEARNENRSGEVQSAPGQIARAVGAFPGFHPGLIQQLPDIGNAPVRIHAMEQHACYHYNPGPIQAQIENVAHALFSDHAQGLACRAMLTTLLTDPEVMLQVQIFARRHLDATHATERKHLGIANTADMVTAFVLAVTLLYSGRFEALAAQTPHLAKATEQLQQLAGDLKSIEPRNPPATRARRQEAAKSEGHTAAHRNPPPDPTPKVTPAQRDTPPSGNPVAPAQAPVTAVVAPLAVEPPSPQDLTVQFRHKEEDMEGSFSMPQPFQLEGAEQLQGSHTPGRLDYSDVAAGSYSFALDSMKIDDNPLK